MSAYYNEFDPYAAEWLRNLISAGLIASGDVDERDIRDVGSGDIAGYTQCHFFAGIGVWSYALRLAGWPDDRPVWTGSCPCQPFSAAGRRKGAADERHLWPHWFHLIGQCRPDTIFGEQVARKDGLAWLDLVQADLEGVDYAIGAVPYPAAGVGAPHMRERTYFVAHTESDNTSEPSRRSGAQNPSASGELAHTDNARPQGRSKRRDGSGERPSGPSSLDTQSQYPGPVNGFWRDADWLRCRDEKWRPVEPGTLPLAHGVAARVGQLRAYGNALVAPQAAAFIASYREMI